jgi:prepilin-type N-terminal cleavage/methylation domain-containing protein
VNRNCQTNGAFSLVELMVVVSIIAILTYLTLPVLASVKKKALVNRTQLEVNNIANGIRSYDTDYGKLSR